MLFMLLEIEPRPPRQALYDQRALFPSQFGPFCTHCALAGSSYPVPCPGALEMSREEASALITCRLLWVESESFFELSFFFLFPLTQQARICDTNLNNLPQSVPLPFLRLLGQPAWEAVGGLKSVLHRNPRTCFSEQDSSG